MKPQNVLADTLTLDPAAHDSAAWRGLAKLSGLTANAFRLPTGVIARTDEVFKVLADRQIRWARIYREAEPALRGVRDPVERQKVIDAMAERVLRGDLAEETATDAAEFARFQTFQSELGDFGKGLQAFLAHRPYLKVILPFIRTPSNIVKQALRDRTPLGLFSRELRETLARGGPESDIALARMALGTGAFAWACSLAADGRIVGGGKKGRSTSDASGVAPYSVKIGDHWLQFSRFDPFGILLGLAADFVELSNAESLDGDETDNALDAGLAAMTAVTRNVTSKTWLQGLSDFVAFMDDPERHSTDWVASTGYMLVPFGSAVRAASNAGDEYSREAFSVMDRWRAQIPGLRDDLPERRDLLGRPVKARASALNPFTVSIESNDPLDRELAALDFRYSLPEKTVGGVPLTAKQWTRLLEIRGQQKFNGRSMEDELRALIASPEYAALEHDEAKGEAIKQVMEAYGRVARNQLVADDGKLRELVNAAKAQREASMH